MGDLTDDNRRGWLQQAGTARQSHWLLGLNGQIAVTDCPLRRRQANALPLKLRVPPNRITDSVRGRRAVTAETALRLGRYFGTDAKFWIDLQASRDLAVAERNPGTAIDREIDPG
jgi:addiction module HigA family antidote